MYPRLKLREEALRAGNDTFLWNCGFHGETLYDTKAGHCPLCNLASAHLPPKRRALQIGSVIYSDTCETHGFVDHDTKSGKCQICHDRRGRLRTGTASSTRAAARNAGATSYLKTCERHGQTAFSVAHGQCLTCFTSMGGPRKFMRVPMPPS